jgi:hypothetical protein
MEVDQSGMAYELAERILHVKAASDDPLGTGKSYRYTRNSGSFKKKLELRVAGFYNGCPDDIAGFDRTIEFASINKACSKIRCQSSTKSCKVNLQLKEVCFTFLQSTSVSNLVAPWNKQTLPNLVNACAHPTCVS